LLKLNQQHIIIVIIIIIIIIIIKEKERKEDTTNSTGEIEREIQLGTNAPRRKLRQPTKPGGRKLRLKLEG